MSDTTWIALLRGINVGGNKLLAMADLRAMLASSGYANVRTHIQSGNAIFDARQTAARLEQEISSSIRRAFGLEVTVIVRTAAELAGVVAANPFAARDINPKELHVTFLDTAPAHERTAGIDPRAYLPDEFALGNRAVYLRLTAGVTGSRLPNWEQQLGVRITTRNWNTTTRLLELTR